MSGGDESGGGAGDGPGDGSGDGSGEAPKGPNRQALSDVLASIRALVSAETSARIHEPDEAEEDVLMLTQDMRVDTRAEFERSIGGMDRDREPGGARFTAGAPIHDEEALRGLVSEILREELRGEFGERISRDLRKIVRREVDDALRADRRGDQPGV